MMTGLSSSLMSVSRLTAAPARNWRGTIVSQGTSWSQKTRGNTERLTVLRGLRWGSSDGISLRSEPPGTAQAWNRSLVMGSGEL